MSSKSLMSLFAGTPQLEQLSDDLREAELNRQAPRLVVSEREYQAMSGELYDFADIRGWHFVTHREETPLDRSLGTFRLKNGRLGFFVELISDRRR